MDKSVKTGWLRNHTLKAAGITYLLGDTCLFISGLMSGRFKEAMAGLLYASGGAVSAIFGNPSAERQIKNIGVRLGDFLIQSGAQIPAGSRIEHILKNRRGGLTEKVTNFLYRHPSETHNAIYAYGGLKLIQSGFAKHTLGNSRAQAGWWEDVAAGGFVSAGGAVGALCPENKDGNFITQKPLRTSGFFYMLNNIFLIKSGWGEYKSNPGQRSYIFKFLTAGFFIGGNILMSLSSRQHSASTEEIDIKRLSVETMAAEIIAAQTETMRAPLVRQVAGFLSSQPEMRQEMAAVISSLEQKVAALQPLQAIAKSAPSEMWQNKMRTAPAEQKAMQASF